MSTTCYELIGRSLRQQRTLRHRGLEKLALNSGTTRREREKCPTLHRHQTLAESPLSLCTLEDPQTLAIVVVVVVVRCCAFL